MYKQGTIGALVLSFLISGNVTAKITTEDCIAPDKDSYSGPIQDAVILRSGEGGFDCSNIKNHEGRSMDPIPSSDIHFDAYGSWTYTGDAIWNDDAKEYVYSNAPDVVLQGTSGKGAHCASFYVTTVPRAGDINSTNFTDGYDPSSAVGCTDGELNAQFYRKDEIENKAEISPTRCVAGSGEPLGDTGYVCPFVGKWGKQTVVIVEDYEDTFDEFGNVIQAAVPGKGFINDGTVTLDNVCSCLGSEYIVNGVLTELGEEALEACNPDPNAEYIDGEPSPNYKPLPGDEAFTKKCVVSKDTDLGIKVEVQNPTCTTVRGRLYCY